MPQQSTYLQPQQNTVVTPFLPSNQIPGAFRPIIYKDKQPSTHNTHSNSNNVPEALHTQNIKIIPSTPKPFYLPPADYKQENVQQHKYVTYLQPPEQQYIQLVQSTSQPVANNINEPIFYQVKPISKPVSTKIRPTVTILQATFNSNAEQNHGINSELTVQNENLYDSIK